MASDQDAPQMRLRPATPEDRFLIRRWFAGVGLESVLGQCSEHRGRDDAGDEQRFRVVPRDRVRRYWHRLRASNRHRSLRQYQAARCSGWNLGCPYLHGFAGTSRRRQRRRILALTMLVDEVFATTLAVACSGVVSVKSEGAARVFERAGFLWLQIWHDPLFGPAWLMVQERSHWWQRRRPQADLLRPAAAKP